MSRVITFSTNISAGHRRAAEAVARAIKDFIPGAVIAERDAMKLLGNTRRNLLTRAYLGIIERYPSLWNYLYHSKKMMPFITGLGRNFILKSVNKFEDELDTFQPDVIICTQAIPARIIADIRRRGRCGRCRAPLLAVATDYGIHPYWIDPHIDAYAVPCEPAAIELKQEGVPEEKIFVTGIPVDKVFENPPLKEIARKRLGILSDRGVVLVMGGGNGLGLKISDIESIESAQGVSEVIVITGSNDQLAMELRALPLHKKIIRRIFPIVERIEDYYAAADILVSKPGGLTMAEATTMGIPIVMISPLPGQEVRNADFLERCGAAVMAGTSEELRSTIANILRDSIKRQNLVDAAKAVGRPSAAMQIARIAMSLSKYGRLDSTRAVND
ncbi:TPA: hypothetical protein DEF17_01740 [bacterium]|nr:MAG: hypothetical protein AUJ18_06620 [Candidatus Hydrogenedentes bacterium CG1_02_42_14]PIU47288.1 MAG: hypothetical protein COS94_08035 [Candidatus Hydrogenedentes bacterium CG07_land_8_20_14_0_80_42_17]HBW46638.1 hypothetical protein [bacterium]